MSDVTMVFDAETAKLVSGFLRIEDRQKALERRSAALSNATRRHSRTAVRGAHDWRQSLMAVSHAIGLAQKGLSAFGAIIAKIDQHSASIAENFKESAQSLIAFTMMQEPGAIRKRALAATRLGAQYGVAPGPALATVQAYQAKFGSFAKGMDAATAAFALSQRAGVPIEGAKAAVAVGTGLRYTPRQAARLAYAAGKASQLTPAELAEMAGKGLPAYTGIKGKAVTGYGVAAALSGLIQDPGNLATYTRQVGTLLQQRTGAVGKTWQQLGFAQPGQAPIAQLRALKKAGITSMGDLQAAGFAKKESLGLSILLADLDQAVKTMQEVERVYKQPGVLFRERAAAEREVPEIRLHRRLEQIDARIRGMQTLGRDAQRSMQWEIMKARRAEQMVQAGHGWMLGQDRRVGGWFWPMLTPYMGEDLVYTIYGFHNRNPQWSPRHPGQLLGMTPQEVWQKANPQAPRAPLRPVQAETQAPGVNVQVAVQPTVTVTPRAPATISPNGE